MEHLSRYGRRMKLTMIAMSIVASFVCLIASPVLSKNILKNEVGYYTIIINGSPVGSGNSQEEVMEALSIARQELSKQYDEYVYMDPDIEIVKEKKIVGERMEVEELSHAIYSCMFDNVLDIDMKMVYVLRIDDYIVTMASKEDIVHLFEKIIANYDKDGIFAVNMVTTDSATGTYGIQIAEKKLDSTSAEIVASKIDGTAVVNDNGQQATGDGLIEIAIAENVVISETSASNSAVTSVETAYENITKEHAEKSIYVVKAGDCLSVIAANNGLSLSELFKLNPSYDEDTIIAPGDELVITVPASEITVLTTRQLSYEEDYEADIIYIDDDSQYRGTNYVVEEGTTGHRSVIAKVVYANGNESSREYLQQTITVEATPKTVAVGTLTPPTYIKPIYGGIFTSGFEYRWGSFHKGVDWYVVQGTTVFAAADGVVSRAGWFADYGYCVDVTHNNGTMTRYAHLSSIAVSYGESVSQWETIGYSGATGYVTGPHLHFEVWIGGTPVNPLNYVNKY